MCRPSVAGVSGDIFPPTSVSGIRNMILPGGHFVPGALAPDGSESVRGTGRSSVPAGVIQGLWGEELKFESLIRGIHPMWPYLLGLILGPANPRRKSWTVPYIPETTKVWVHRIDGGQRFQPFRKGSRNSRVALYS